MKLVRMETAWGMIHMPKAAPAEKSSSPTTP